MVKVSGNIALGMIGPDGKSGEDPVGLPGPGTTMKANNTPMPFE